MRIVRAIFAGMVCATLAMVAMMGGTVVRAQSVGQSEVSKRFVGSWKLVSITGGTDTLASRGPRPTGMLSYDATGHMIVQVVPDRPRPKYTGALTPDQAKNVLLGYTAYFGTYTVDEDAKTVTHHQEGSVSLAGVMDLVRRYEFSGDRLILTTVGNQGPATVLTWERIK